MIILLIIYTLIITYKSIKKECDIIDEIDR